MSMTASPQVCTSGGWKAAPPVRLSVSPLVLFFLLAASLLAQRPHPAHWSLTPQQTAVAPGASVLVELKLDLDAPWHMYSPTTPKPGPTGGPIPTTIELESNPAIAGSTLYFPAPNRKFDPNFNLDTATYEKSVKFYFKVDLASDTATGPVDLTAKMRYQLCTDTECLPPKRVTATAKLDVNPGVRNVAPSMPEGYAEFRRESAPAAAPPPPQQSGGSPQPIGSFLLVAFGFGLAAIFTPCVFPMIPITLSFFLNQGAATRRQALMQAAVFCLGIIVLFTGLGFGVTAALGPFGVTQMASNPWVNGFISLVFFAFALSLLGAFEITLPSGLLTKMNAASNRGGYLGVLLMGLTFSLTSFACVGPFVGTLLVASVQGDLLQPVLGMAAFSAGLALPFFFLALFPGYLERLPRSGGWMARVKIVMGFLILAAMLKYLSNVDAVMQWELLTRERFLAIWTVLFALPGLYLLGLLPMEGVKRDQNLGVGRLLVGASLLALAISFIPGMFGVRLGQIEAFIPSPGESSAAAAGTTARAAWLKNDLDGALAKAKSDNKRVLVAFTGYACTNCHWMKANMFTRPEIGDAMQSLVAVELYTDGTDTASEANQKRQESEFKTVAIPFYAILDSDGKTLATFAGLTRDQAQFLAFLKTGA
ncbi:MAG TPA: cytochrome c biogenesis protein CcdA [Bryobacteraceae bacterium]|nr:cytochrome c biogenesis protein CcdA [Bryobacteraceae bacterium]